MKSQISNLKSQITNWAAAAFLAALAPSAPALQSVPATLYPLTNSLAGTTNYIAITNGFTTLNSNCVYIVNCQPFQVWRGRGFAFNTAILSTNANSPTATFTFRFANVHGTNWIANAGAVTNWTTMNNLAVGVQANGPAPVFAWTNIQPASVDNVQLAQLYSIAVSATAGALLLDPTNTYISVYP